jgi:hypothetical protein
LILGRGRDETEYNSADDSDYNPGLVGDSSVASYSSDDAESEVDDDAPGLVGTNTDTDTEHHTDTEDVFIESSRIVNGKRRSLRLRYGRIGRDMSTSISLLEDGVSKCGSINFNNWKSVLPPASADFVAADIKAAGGLKKFVENYCGNLTIIQNNRQQLLCVSEGRIASQQEIKTAVPSEEDTSSNNVEPPKSIDAAIATVTQGKGEGGSTSQYTLSPSPPAPPMDSNGWRLAPPYHARPAVQKIPPPPPPSDGEEDMLDDSYVAAGQVQNHGDSEEETAHAPEARTYVYLSKDILEDSGYSFPAGLESVKDFHCSAASDTLSDGDSPYREEEGDDEQSDVESEGELQSLVSEDCAALLEETSQEVPSYRFKGKTTKYKRPKRSGVHLLRKATTQNVLADLCKG